MSNRKEFAKQYKIQPSDFWHKVIFSDESKFELMNNRRRQYVWRKKGDGYKIENLKPTIKHGGGSILVWGCFSYKGIGNLVFIDDKLTGIKYVDILKQNLLQSAIKFGIESEFVFQQDNDPKHKSKVATKNFEENKICVLPWPANSPDLNPIEHLWDEIDRKVPSSSRKNKTMFKAAIEDAWNNIPLEFLQKLVNSVPTRLESVWKASGGHTRY